MADSFVQRAGYALSAGQQLPSRVDKQKLRTIAEELDRLHAPGSTYRDKMIADLTSGQEHRAFEYTITMSDRVKGGATAQQLLDAAPYLLLLDGLRRKPEAKRTLEAAFESQDLAAISRGLKELGIESNPAWAARLYRNLPEGNVDGVSLRAEGAGQVRARLGDLTQLLDRIGSEEDPKQKTALRESAAELFASIVNLYALLDATTRYREGINLEHWFERLGTAGIPGFLASKGGADFEVLGQQATTRFDLHNPVIQLVAVPLQLETRGHDPSRYRPGDSEPVIKVADDRVHLGTDDRPIGFVSNDGKYAFVPSKIDLVLVNRSPYGPSGHFGFGEMPIGAFSFEARYYGTALKVPIEVEVGGVKLRLSHGEYRPLNGEATVETAPGLVRIEANGVAKTIDTKTGAVS